MQVKGAGLVAACPAVEIARTEPQAAAVLTGESNGSAPPYAESSEFG